MKFRELKHLPVVALVAVGLALAGCGGGGGSSPTAAVDQPTPEEMCMAAGGRWNADSTCTSADELAAEMLAARQMAQREAISDAIDAAETAVAGVGDDSTSSEVASADAAVATARSAIEGAADLPEAETDANTGTVDAIANRLDAAKTSRTAAMDAADEARTAAMAKTGKALHAALAGTSTTTNALNNIGAPTLATAGLTIDAAAGAGTLPAATNPDAVTLKAGDSAGSLGGWAGTDYADTNKTTKIKNEARVYTNRGAPTTQRFSGTGGKYTLIATEGPTKGHILLGDGGSPVSRARATAFNHSGTQNHSIPSNAVALLIRGTYDGAPGQFRCVGTSDSPCSSTNDGKDGPSALGGTSWHFKPDAGAMVSKPDDEYLYFGWWVSKDKDGAPTAASAFTGVVEPTAGDLDKSVHGNSLGGSATYAGKAAGKYAINNVLEGTGHGGHFTADAELIATFGQSTDSGAAHYAANAGMTGTIDNFRLNDGSSDPGWSVSLHRAGWGDTGMITAPTDVDSTANVDESKGTTWSINDNAAPASGTWSGQMYDEKPGNVTPTGPGDGSNIPTTVTGTFYSEFSSIGRMVGAFGASKQ